MKKTLAIINELKEKGLIKDYAIGGAIGVLRWVEPFFTRDLDIFLIPSQKPQRNIMDLSLLYEHLKSKGYDHWVGQWILLEGIPTEFIPAEGLAQESVENAQEIDFEGVKTKVITPEYLIALLLRVAREKDLAKIRMLLEQAAVQPQRLNDILERHDLGGKFKAFRKGS